MEKSVEIEASSVEIAVEKALVELNSSRDKVDIEILSKGGLFQKAKVRVTLNTSLKDELNDFVNGILEHMGLVSRASVDERDGVIYITIEGEDSGVAIGYRGEALDAFQYLCLTFLNERDSDFKKVVVDCENYREKRKVTLTGLAERLAEKAVRLCRKIALEPMNPFERRIIHSALADSELATTTSEGDEPNRYVVIIPKGVELKDNRPIKNGSRDDNRSSRGNDRRDGGRKNYGDRSGRGGFERDRRGGRDYDRRDDYKPRDSRPREEEPEVEDGKVYRGYYTAPDEFVKPADSKTGPPKFKSFGGKKKF